MAGLLLIVSRTKPGTYHYMKRVSGSGGLLTFSNLAGCGCAGRRAEESLSSPNLSRRFPMPRRPPPYIDAELTGRLAAIEIARAQLFGVDADRKKRIDRLIDYFGTPLIAVARDRVCRSPAAQIIVLADWQDMET
jgi:hypothetical protein